MSESPSNTLLSPRFLFRLAVPVKRCDQKWQSSGIELDESFRLPELAALDAGTQFRERYFADLRMAWSPEGLIFDVEVSGKQQPVWCRESRLEDSDGLQLWIDTRAIHNVHRASRYCHRLVFLPAGGGRDATGPVADQLLINRARENARPIRPRELQAASRVDKGGYRLRAWVPAAVLGGYDPTQHTQLGFTYLVSDRELGLQTFATGPGLPFDEDPSCWATVELIA